jgi:hypothetical protein
MEVSPYHLKWIEKCARFARVCADDADKISRLAQEVSKCLLVKAAAKRPLDLSVPPVVDAVWHTMILDTQSYRAFCIDLLGNTGFVHHTPFTTEDSEEDKLKRVHKLLTFYVNLTGSEPSEQDAWIWEGFIAPTPAPTVAEPSANKKRKTKRKVLPLAKAKLSGGRTNAPYTFNGKKYTVQVVDGILYGDLRTILAKRHHVDIIFLGYGDGVEYSADRKNRIIPMPRPSEMQIFVKGLDGDTHTFSVKSEQSVEALKIAIFNRLSHSPCEQRLIFSGNQLEDGNTLASYNISVGDTVHLVMRLRGC